MRILLCLPNLGGGGAESVGIDLVTALRDLGHDADIFCARAQGPLLGRAREACGVMGGPAGGTGFEWRMPVIRQLTRCAHSYDVLVAGLELQTSVAVAWAARCSDRPAVLHVHSVLPEFLGRAVAGRGAAAPLARASHRAYRPFYRNQRFLIACSQAARDGVLALGARPDAVSVVPNGVDCRRVREGGAAPHGDAVGSLIGVGSLLDLKGFDRLIGILPWLPEGIRLVLVGDGPARGFLEAHADTLGVSHRVTFAGRQENPHAWMAGARALVVSSHTEAYPMVVAEAACLGVPVVSWDDLPGVHEVLGQRAPVVGADSAVQTAGNLLNALSGLSAAPPAVPLRTTSEMARDCLRVYECAIQAGNGRRRGGA